MGSVLVFGLVLVLQWKQLVMQWVEAGGGAHMHVMMACMTLEWGAEPKELAFSAALGITLGVFPIVVFLRFGEFLTGGAHFPLTADALKKVLTGQASKEILLSIVHALLGWFVLAPFILGLLYIVLVPCFTMLVRKSSSSITLPERDDEPSYTEVMLKSDEIDASFFSVWLPNCGKSIAIGLINYRVLLVRLIQRHLKLLAILVKRQEKRLRMRRGILTRCSFGIGS
ncbi:hypothetical protein L1987_08911 [Smallanthus sonchifolius]|uniref:Uncharacterized protein n=1 Tax=Smallanthus sonchifolius TaxID=185202 RepID=A0ACB9JP18_9ASTR|nr:hypothetical protein L1987_08911 [Smallanthus sonchifolius]